MHRRIADPPQGSPSGPRTGRAARCSVARAVRRQVNTAPGERAAAGRLVNGNAKMEFPRLQLQHD